MTRVSKLGAALAVILISNGGFAAPYCMPYHFLQPRFNIQNFTECQLLFKKCPKQGPYVDAACAKSVIKTNTVCKQLGQLAKKLHAGSAFFSAKPSGRYVILEQTFPADGQQEVYIISPKNCLLKTNRDPRRIDKNLRDKFKKITLITTNVDKPIKKTLKNHVTSFTVTLRMNKECLACEVLGNVKVSYLFNASGDFLKAQTET